MSARRLTSYAHGGGCACKIPPGELEAVLAGLGGRAASPFELLVGVETGDDAAVVRVGDELAVVSTADFITPIVDDAYDWGRIAATNALSDVYAQGGRPVVAVNLLGWPRGELPLELAAQVLRGGVDAATAVGCHVAGGHSVDDPEPKYGMAVTGLADPQRLLRNDAGRPGDPLTLTKPLGLGVLANQHKATGTDVAAAVAVMTTPNAAASTAAVAAGATCATDVTGFGLLGHLHKLARASGCAAVVDVAAVPLVEGARAAAAAGYVPGGTRRNLEWVRPHLAAHDPGRPAGRPVDDAVAEDTVLLLADAQTSGGLLVAAELAGFPVVGQLVAGEPGRIILRE